VTSDDVLSVFVYGSLRVGGDNHRLLDGAEPLGNGTINGRLYVSSGLSTVREGAGTVHGEVYRLPDHRHLRLLDGLERHPVWYRRQIVAVRLEDGTTVDAWCYSNTERDPDARLVEHGDYLRFREESRS
jgi:gamma-glutamylcyclotransferase (GGCT)/AIG2-like uncharacterized protein YtfP